MWSWIRLIFLSSFFTLSAQAQFFGTPCDLDSDRMGSQVGSVWDRVEASDVNPNFRFLVQGMAAYRGGTAFYLGYWNGHYLMATNAHVQPEMKCASPEAWDSAARFESLEHEFACEKVFGTWKEIELSIFSISVPKEYEAFFKPLGASFAFHTPLQMNEKLFTLGFGSACNPNSALTMTTGPQCQLFSKPNDFKFMKDPDEAQTSVYATWAMAIGCNVSHGDSGSPVLDRETGKVVGILYTGKFPKPETAQDDAFLETLLKSKGEGTWTMLNYAVPSLKIGEFLEKWVKTPALDSDTQITLQALLGASK